MEEVWKDIAGYEGLYQVSNKGNVKSLNWGNRGYSKNLYLKPHCHGYLQVELANKGKKKMFMVHRLVAMAFIDNPLDLPMINHKDENKENNCVDNLEWCDCSYNVRYSLHNRKKVAHRRCFGRVGKNTLKKVAQISANGSVVRIWNNAREVFLTTGMSDWSISECCRGNRKTAYGYCWQYAN